ncbi:hypothetical protein ZIOFF_064838 [Zingiber officinale]|uniref:Uncharacterized protein n=1 Tax=Zingiber officinale TaxID=94328 RepID=A0A8J5EWE6_ZINOF|nr:hypothetical protein ZIOFF_064838 [Zingiber officinale]
MRLRTGIHWRWFCGGTGCLKSCSNDPQDENDVGCYKGRFCRKRMVILVDLKTSDILIDTYYSAKVTGFKFLKSGLVDGSYSFVVSHDTYAIYSLSLILLELIMGSKPGNLSDTILPKIESNKFPEIADPTCADNMCSNSRIEPKLEVTFSNSSLLQMERSLKVIVLKATGQAIKKVVAAIGIIKNTSKQIPSKSIHNWLQELLWRTNRKRMMWRCLMQADARRPCEVAMQPIEAAIDRARRLLERPHSQLARPCKESARVTALRSGKWEAASRGRE